MKRFFCVFTFMFIAFTINADMYHDPNHYFDYDQQTSGFCYASAYASENYNESTDTYAYYASAAVSYDEDGPGWNDPASWSMTVEATAMEHETDSGITFAGGGENLSTYGYHMYEQSYAQSYSSMESACAYAGI